MSRALSIDLRVRVLSAVAAGASHREAAERFGVSAASVSRWRAREREVGTPRPKALGGDRRSQAMEAHGATILALVAQNRDFTLAEIRAELLQNGIRSSIGGLWRFFARHKITLKKSRRTRVSRTARTS
jgi:transposase